MHDGTPEAGAQSTADASWARAIQMADKVQQHWSLRLTCLSHCALGRLLKGWRSASTGLNDVLLQHACQSSVAVFRDPEQIKYKTYQDYYAMRWKQDLLNPEAPLLMGRAFVHSAASVNYLSPEKKRTVLHNHQRECAAIAAARLNTSSQEKDVDVDALKKRWGGDGQGLMWPLIPPELCLVHWLPMQSVHEMQYLPSLMFRLEVRCHASA
jgi:hypothetical protein